jgi:hypothetical protein
MGLLFEKQPEWCRQKLDVTMLKGFDKLHENLKQLRRKEKELGIQ